MAASISVVNGPECSDHVVRFLVSWDWVKAKWQAVPLGGKTQSLRTRPSSWRQSGGYTKSTVPHYYPFEDLLSLEMGTGVLGGYIHSSGKFAIQITSYC